MGAVELLVTLVIPLLAVATIAWLRFQPTFNVTLLPALGLSVLLVGSVLGHEFFHISAGPIPITFDRLLLAAAASWFGWRFLTGREDLLRLNRVDMAILIWLVVISISTLTHDFQVLNNMPASRLLFFNWLPVLLYLIVRHCQITAGDLKFIATVMGALGIYLALTGVAEMKGFEALVYPKYILQSDFREFLGRGRGPFLNPVSNGIFQTLCFCCLLAWWPHQTDNGQHPWNRNAFVIVGLALVICLGVYATLTRSTWIGLVAACGIFVFVPAPRQAKGLMLMGATVAALFLAPVLADKVLSFKRDQDVSQADMEQSAQMRPMFALVAWNMFQDRPLAGVGFGQYYQAKTPYLKDPHTGLPLTITKSLTQHNVFLAYLTETGLIGLAALLGLLSQFARMSWSVWRDDRLHLWPRQIALIGLVLVSAYCINGMFHDVSIVPQMHMLLFFWMGLVNNVYSRREPMMQPLPVEECDEKAMESVPLAA